MAAEQKIIYGYVEKAILIDKDMTISAKLDTGAKSASLSAVDIHEIEKDGKRYLVFKVPDKTKEVQFMSEYLGKVKIKARMEENTISSEKLGIIPIKRSVVMMRIKLGNLVQTIPVNLTNRKRFNYPLLLGRDAIRAFNGIIDPSKTFVVKNKNNANEIE